ncbi:MAG TPA: tetratricopeptide repeat protein [Planctomycetes bacterium]|nr:tetratricopeptide repeat protein [Planctomycetota bacterium]HIJ71816.1 tetratricopeptide repeat protein [Planctomycetota bacterium]
MKTVPPKSRFIFTAAFVELVIFVVCAQTLAASEQTEEIINNSQVARRNLRQADILSVADLQNSDSNGLQKVSSAKEQLQQAIEQIQTLKPPIPETPTATGAGPAQPAHKPEASQLRASEISKRQKKVTTHKQNEKQTRKTAPIEDTHRALTNLISNPENVLDPLATAEALFQSGNLKDAAKFYRLALERIADKTEHPDRPWAMFQAANCLRHQQPTEAYKLYQQLINEYPSSDWTAAAYSHQQVIKWYQQDKPGQILEKYNSDPNSF